MRFKRQHFMGNDLRSLVSLFHGITSFTEFTRGKPPRRSDGQAALHAELLRVHLPIQAAAFHEQLVMTLLDDRAAV